VYAYVHGRWLSATDPLGLQEVVPSPPSGGIPTGTPTPPTGGSPGLPGLKTELETRALVQTGAAGAEEAPLATGGAVGLEILSRYFVAYQVADFAAHALGVFSRPEAPSSKPVANCTACSVSDQYSGGYSPNMTVSSPPLSPTPPAPQPAQTKSAPTGPAQAPAATPSAPAVAPGTDVGGPVMTPGPNAPQASLPGPNSSPASLPGSSQQRVLAVDKPTGVPADWVEKPSKKGGGKIWTDPTNPHNSVRSMPGNPTSPHAAQRQPYIKRMQAGKAQDVTGDPVSPDSEAAHIPTDQFTFRP